MVRVRTVVSNCFVRIGGIRKAVTSRPKHKFSSVLSEVTIVSGPPREKSLYSSHCWHLEFLMSLFAMELVSVWWTCGAGKEISSSNNTLKQEPRKTKQASHLVRNRRNVSLEIFKSFLESGPFHIKLWPRISSF